MLVLWGMWDTPLLPLLPGPLWPRMLAPDRVLSMGQIELCAYAKLNCLKQLFICIKMDLALNNLQWLICHLSELSTGVITLVIYSE